LEAEASDKNVANMFCHFETIVELLMAMGGGGGALGSATVLDLRIFLVITRSFWREEISVGDELRGGKERVNIKRSIHYIDPRRSIAALGCWSWRCLSQWSAHLPFASQQILRNFGYDK
jgi:hypothetical protein